MCLRPFTATSLEKRTIVVWRIGPPDPSPPFMAQPEHCMRMCGLTDRHTVLTGCGHRDGGLDGAECASCIAHCTQGTQHLVVPVIRSCQSPTWIWLVNYLHLHYIYKGK